MLYILVFLFVVAADQLSKAFVDASLSRGDGISVIKGVFSITNTRTSGAAFSMLSDSDWSQVFFIAITVVAIALALLYMIFGKANSKWLNTTVALIAGGAIGNFIDRLAFREVRDFLFIEFFANCNVADVAITVGAIMLIVYLLFIADDALFKRKKTPDQAQTGGNADENA
ncbi:MAG: signal peptidase II [Clostridia bacterium]|nr:signal peptidase II [Clostridia bacterium]